MWLIRYIKWALDCIQATICFHGSLTLSTPWSISGILPKCG